MPTSPADAVFVDTNVLVYAHVAEAPWHADAVQTLAAYEATGTALWVSHQVLREYLVALTRPQQFALPPPLETVLAQVRQFQQRFLVANEGPAVTTQLLTLLTDVPTRGRRIHDANIVATMLVHSVGRVLTNNTDDFQRFAAFVDILPFPTPPAAGA